ncbi:MAG: hypothetical protein PHR11_00870 [Candidatus Omnitrophica bacterium]|nr:hypothetical protein [Candidatus Omnitrophota bacterium]
MKPDASDRKNLRERYLLWLYKTTREEFDRIERKFTQLEVDKALLARMKKLDAHKAAAEFIEGYRQYMQKKEAQGLRLKYKGKGFLPQYHFLALKLEAIEKTIAATLGKGGLHKMKRLYEQEMRRRILESTGH